MKCQKLKQIQFINSTERVQVYCYEPFEGIDFYRLPKSINYFVIFIISITNITNNFFAKVIIFVCVVKGFELMVIKLQNMLNFYNLLSILISNLKTFPNYRFV